MNAPPFASLAAAVAALLLGCAEMGPTADSDTPSAEAPAAADRRANATSPEASQPAAPTAPSSAAEMPDSDAASGAVAAGHIGEDTAKTSTGPANRPVAGSQEASRPALPFEAARELVGRSGDDVAALLGPPGFRRRDGPAEVWQYRGRACLLDVFLYDGRKGRRVAYAEIRRRNGVHLSDRECVADIVAAVEGKSG